MTGQRISVHIWSELLQNTETEAETPFIPSSGENAETIFAALSLSAILTLLVKSNSSRILLTFIGFYTLFQKIFITGIFCKFLYKYSDRN